MKFKITYILVLAVIVCLGGCSNTRYLTDSKSIGRQHEMRASRTGNNVGDVFINIVNFVFAAILNSGYEAYSSERTFKRITIINESSDSLFVNMVTDVVWKESGYCDIMGIVLPPGAKQKLLAPYPAAYNVYFKTPFTEEENLEIRTDNKHRKFRLHKGMTHFPIEK